MDKIDQKPKTKTFLIGKELKKKDLLQTAAERASEPTTKPNPNPPDSLRQGGESSRWRGSYAALRPCG